MSFTIKSLSAPALFAVLAVGVYAQATPPAASPQDTKQSNAHTADRKMANASDSQFIAKAAQGGLAEVELGKMAQEHGSSDAVKQFGQRMADDHSKANEELSRIAQAGGVTVPTNLDAKGQAMKDKLSKLNGAAFDRAYMSEMLKDHREDVAEFQKEANTGQNPEVKAFAAKTLPTLQEHLRLAEETLRAAKK
jgi:putative membrane protein